MFILVIFHNEYYLLYQAEDIPLSFDKHNETNLQINRLIFFVFKKNTIDKSTFNKNIFVFICYKAIFI